MKKVLLAAIALLSATQAFAAAPAVDFRSILDPTNSSAVRNTFNSAADSSVLNIGLSGIDVHAFTYASDTYTASALWLRNGSNDHGFGVCSEGTSACNSGGGNVNELDNLGNDEVIRLKKASSLMWTDVWISSLDHSEQAQIFWSNNASLNLGTATDFVTVGASFFPGSNDEGSIVSVLSANINWNPNADYLYFRAGGPGAPGSDNDYLVWGVTAVPEPEIYAMLAAGLGLMGFVARRRRQKDAAG